MSKNYDPMSKSKFMGKREAQIPLRITPKLIESSTYIMERDRNCGYQARARYEAAKKWADAKENGSYVCMGISGAFTPVGLGGLVADLTEIGAVDFIVTTGANLYHDLHFAFGLPVRHGSHKVDDNKLRKDRKTRIYTQFIDSDYTLKAQDMLIQDFSKRVLPKLNQPFSSAEYSYGLGKEMLNDKSDVVDKKGSMLIRAAEHEMPIILDSNSNHSIGMNLARLSRKGYKADMSPTRDILQTAALSMKTQPQLNMFFGEGGPRNFIQTTAPTACEIFGIPFKGSDFCIRFTTADETYGALSGSSQNEAVSWGKYGETGREIEVRGDYTLSAQLVAGYVAGRIKKQPSRLMGKLDEITDEFFENIDKNESRVERMQNRLRRNLPDVVRNEIKARKKAGYEFD